jgi:plastocyanin
VKTPTVVAAACRLQQTGLPATAATTPSLTGTVGPGETITVTKKPTKAGTYKLVVRDRSDEHNFRLRGAGINVATSVDGTGTKTFTLKLKRGKTYTFICDPHADDMRGSFRVRA